MSQYNKFLEDYLQCASLPERELLVKPVPEIDVVDVTTLSPDIRIVTFSSKSYAVVKRSFTNRLLINRKPHLPRKVLVDILDVGDWKGDFPQIHSYGDKHSFIVDMQGISSLLLAKCLHFHDWVVRNILKEIGLLAPREFYLRFGASGALQSSCNPGGELLELSIINGEDGSGVSQSACGSLASTLGYSRTISLKDVDGEFLREDRIVYSHTAWLKSCQVSDSMAIPIRLKIKEGLHSLLELINALASCWGCKSYAVQIFIKHVGSASPFITGRVLNELPSKPLRSLSEAAKIGTLQSFPLVQNQMFMAMGTRFERNEPEWESFTNGRKYEARGHIHGTIIGKEMDDQHSTFHLRDVQLGPDCEAYVNIVPIKDVYRIYPTEYTAGHYVCSTTGKHILQLGS